METLDECLLEIGNKLTRLRINHGFNSYESFAVHYGLSRMQYWRIEKGKTNLTMKSLFNLLSIHKVSLEDFFSKDFFNKFPLTILLLPLYFPVPDVHRYGHNE